MAIFFDSSRMRTQQHLISLLHPGLLEHVPRHRADNVERSVNDYCISMFGQRLTHMATDGSPPHDYLGKLESMFEELHDLYTVIDKVLHGWTPCAGPISSVIPSKQVSFECSCEGVDQIPLSQVQSFVCPCVWVAVEQHYFVMCVTRSPRRRLLQSTLCSILQVRVQDLRVIQVLLYRLDSLHLG